MTTLKATPDGPLPAAIVTYLERAGLDGPRALVLPLTGDASDRRYYRVIPRDGATFVLALNSSPFRFEELPFVNVARLLAEVPVPIPAIQGHADDLGILVQQDLCDVKLQAHLGAAAPAEHTALYRQAIGFLAAIQRRGRELVSDRYVSYRIAFDVDKLTWELDFFVKHFVVAYRGADIPPAAREAIGQECAVIIQELAAETARVVPSRLSQPESDAVRRPALDHRLPGRAHGPGHLRSGVAAARFYVEIRKTWSLLILRPGRPVRRAENSAGV